MINIFTYALIFYLCYDMTMLRRWSTSAIPNPAFNELSKYGYNSLSVFILAARYEEKSDEKINWALLPKIIIFKLLEKDYIFNDLPKQKVKKIANGKFDEKMGKLVEILSEELGKEFIEFLLDGWYGKKTVEEQIVLAATKIATIHELYIIYKIPIAFASMNNAMEEDYNKYQKIHDEKVAEVEEFVTDEVVKELFYDSIDKNSATYKLLSEASENLRNQNRFPTCPYLVECTILGHLFETGILAYVMALEERMSPEEAARYFFMGIWHDFPEAFTRDMPSTIKDGFDLRDASEKSEENAMENNVYSKVSPYVAEKIKAHMFEAQGNEGYRLLTKGADYFSAFYEIMKQFDCGSRSKVFYKAAKEHKSKVNKENVSRLSKMATQYVNNTYEIIEEKIGNQILYF